MHRFVEFLREIAHSLVASYVVRFGLVASLIPSNQTRGLRLVSTYPITQDNQQLLVDLPRGPHIENCFLRVSGTINNSVAYTTVRNLSAHYMFRRVDWVLNSNVTLDSVSGPQALQGMVITRRNLAQSNAPAVGTGNQTLEAVIVLDRSGPDMVRPKDSYLKTDVGVSNNQLRIQMGAIANMYTGAGTSTYVSVNLEIWITDYQEARNKNGQTPYPKFYQKRNGFTSGTLAAGNGQQVRINTGNRLRYLSGRALDGTTGEPNTSVAIGATGVAAYVSRVRIQRAGDTRVDMPCNALVRSNQPSLGPGGTGIGGFIPGQFFVDFASIGQTSGVRYSEFWPIPSSADTYCILDVAASTVVEFVTLEGVDLPTVV